MTEEGILSVWDAVTEGRGLTLLLERDYHIQGFLQETSEILHLKPPKEPHIVLNDAVNELINRTLEKNGKLILVENGMLRNHQHVGLITRY